MTTNKPEVAAYLHTNKKYPEHKDVSLYYDMNYTYPTISTEPLIRLSDYEALQSECDKLRNGLAEAQANDRTAMGYLSDVHKAVGGKDFPEMVRNVTELVEAASELAPYAGGMESIIRDFAGCLGKAEALVSRAKAVGRLLGMLPQPETCLGTGCTDQGCPAHYANDYQPAPEVAVLVKALERIANMGSMSYHSLESAKITARNALDVLAAHHKQAGEP